MNEIAKASKWQQEDSNPGSLNWESNILIAVLPRPTKISQSSELTCFDSSLSSWRVYTCMNTFVHSSLYTCKYIHTSTHACAHTNTHTHARTHTHKHACVHPHHTHTCTHHVYAPMHAPTRVHPSTQARTHARTHTHTHTHTHNSCSNIQPKKELLWKLPLFLLVILRLLRDIFYWCPCTVVST